MIPPFPSLTETWHNTSYDAISPTRPELSLTNKTVIVTGGGRGIGVDIARAFAAAGAAHIILIGRTQTTLSQSAEKIRKEFASVTVSTYASDVADEDAIGKVAAEVKKWDVLILNAGMLADPLPIEKSVVTNWWRSFEVRSVSSSRLIPHFIYSPFLLTASFPISSLNFSLSQIPQAINLKNPYSPRNRPT